MASNLFLPLSQRTGKNKESKEPKEKERKKKWQSTSRARAVKDSWLTKKLWIEVHVLFLQGVKPLGFQFLRIC